MKQNRIIAAALALAVGAALAACGGGVKLSEKDFTYEITADGAGVKLLAYTGDRGGKLILPRTIAGRPVVALGDVDQYHAGGGTEADIDGRRFYGFAELPDEPEAPAEDEAGTAREGSGPAGTGGRMNLAAITAVPVSTNGGKDGPVAEGNEQTGTKARTSRITAVIIPDTVTYIGIDTFGNCERLTAVKLPKSLTVIAGGAFANTGLTSLTVPKGVTVIGSYAFSDCKRLASVTLPENIELRPGAFAYCAALATVKLPAAVSYTYYDGKSGAFVAGTKDGVYFEESAFDNCPGLKDAVREAILASGYPVEFVVSDKPVDRAGRNVLGTWVNKNGKTVAIITREKVYLADILRWARRGSRQTSGWAGYLAHEGDMYELYSDLKNGTARASDGNRWGGYSIGASFSLAADGTLTFTVNNDTEDYNYRPPLSYSETQKFQLRRRE